MDVSLLYEIEYEKPWYDGWEYDKYHEALAQIERADEVGFRTVWAVEHHFLTEFSHSSAPEVWLAAAAQRTDSIRIGHGVVVLPYNHPVRVAERIATMDIISDGRVEFGTGRSVTHEELGGFKLDPAESKPRWREGIEVIPQLFDDGPHAFDGDHWAMGEREVWPKPVQEPHPPMYRACTQPASWEEAGRDGLGVLGFTLATEPDAIGRRVDAYRAELEQADPVGAEPTDHVALFTLGLCAPTDAAAKDRAEDAVVYYMDKSFEYYTEWGESMLEGDTRDVPESYEWYAEASQKLDAVDTKYDTLRDNDMIVSGSPETVIETLQAYEAQGVDEIMFLKQAGRTDHDHIMESIELIGTEVLPAL